MFKLRKMKNWTSSTETKTTAKTLVPNFLVLALSISSLCVSACDPGYNASISGEGQAYAVKAECPVAPKSQSNTRVFRALSEALRAQQGNDAFRLFKASSIYYDVLEGSIAYGLACNPNTGEHRNIRILLSNGKVVTEPEVQKMRAQATLQIAGKITRSLADTIAMSAPDADIPIYIWHESRSPDIERPLHVDPTFVAAFESERNAKNAGLRAAALATAKATGVKAIKHMDSLPIIVAKARASQITSLAAKAEIKKIGYADDSQALLRTSSAGYVGFLDADDSESVEEFTLANYHGTSIRVGLHENTAYAGLWDYSEAFANIAGFHAMANPTSLGCLRQGNGSPCPFAPDEEHDPRFFCRGTLCYGEHITAIASAMGAVNPSQTEFRHAHKMRLFFANFGTKAEKLDWLWAYDVRIVNDSEAVANNQTYRSLYNYAIREFPLTITKAAGNHEGMEVDCMVNSICVGGYKINSSANVDSWKSNPANSPPVYSPAFTYKNDSNFSDAEKPDIVANSEEGIAGSALATPRDGGWTVMAGTSFSAPAIAGLVALLQEYYPASAGWPEIIRPLLMVAAYNHNVHGTPLSRNAGHMDPGDERDGAGAPTALGMKQIVDGNRTNLFALYPSSFDSSGHHNVRYVTVPAGDAIRVALGWTYCVENGDTLLKTNLDLVLIDSSTGYSLDYSNSNTNSVEMLEWKNSTGVSKQVLIRIKLDGNMNSCNGVAREYAGLAWMTYTPQW